MGMGLLVEAVTEKEEDTMATVPARRLVWERKKIANAVSVVVKENVNVVEMDVLDRLPAEVSVGAQLLGDNFSVQAPIVV